MQEANLRYKAAMESVKHRHAKAINFERRLYDANLDNEFLRREERKEVLNKHNSQKSIMDEIKARNKLRNSYSNKLMNTSHKSLKSKE